MSISDLLDSEIFLSFLLLGLAIVGVIIIVSAVAKVKEQNAYNASQPIQTKPCKVIAKEYVVASNPNLGSFVTFEMTTGERKRLRINAQAAAQIIVNDTGRLTFQGDHFYTFTLDRK